MCGAKLRTDSHALSCGFEFGSPEDAEEMQFPNAFLHEILRVFALIAVNRWPDIDAPDFREIVPKRRRVIQAAHPFSSVYERRKPSDLR